MSKDPIALDGGENLYVYVENDPVDNVELLAGLDAEQVEEVDRSGSLSTFDEEAGSEQSSRTMEQALIARVRNGRLVLDEPTDLPAEGEEVERSRAERRREPATR